MNGDACGNYHPLLARKLAPKLLPTPATDAAQRSAIRAPDVLR